MNQLSTQNVKSNILLLDLESGYGGSSKSLFLSVKYLKEVCDDFNIEVWALNIEGVIKKYPSIGVVVRKIDKIPRSTSGNTLTANVLELVRAGLDWHKSRRYLKNIFQEINDRFDLVHFNLEAGYLLAYLLRKQSAIPFVMHMRTIRPVNMFSRMQIRIISKTVNHLIFISSNELERFNLLKGKAKYTVIHNIAENYSSLPLMHQWLVNENRLVVGSIANFSWDRGVDLLVDIAVEIQKLGGQNKVVFAHAGNIEVPKSFPGDLGKCVRNGNSFEDYILDKGVRNMFIFFGHVDKPEEIIQGCDLIIKLFRNGSPYGRDVIEAYSLGKAVLSTGTSEEFVKHMKTGILFPEFNSKDIAKEILKCIDNPKIKEMGENGRLNINEMCNPTNRASDLANLWKGKLN